MDFLQSVLGDDLYSQFAEKVNAYNGDAANKDKMIKLANLTDGGYVSKDKYTSLETDLSGKNTELEKANGLIAELKKSAAKDTNLQQKITEYEATIADLKAENEALRIDNALKFALADAGAVDVDYLVFKAKEKGEIKLDDDGKIKGETELISGLKTQLPAMFSSGQNNGSEGRKILENPLPDSDGDKTVTKDQFRAMGYAERLKLKQDSPEQYNELVKG